MQLYYVIALIIAIVTHEVAHGYVAYLCGDTTAKLAGRLTLNPIRHVDPFGSIILPGILLLSGLPTFGYAKPVPVNIQRLRRPRNQSVLVALAGPGVNLLWLGLAVLVGHLTGCTWSGTCVGTPFLIVRLCVAFAVVNVSLAVFNLLPIPPLDGSALVERLLPKSMLRQYFSFRAIALPFSMVLFIVDSMTWHVTGHLLGYVQDWVIRIVLPN